MTKPTPPSAEVVSTTSMPFKRSAPTTTSRPRGVSLDDDVPVADVPGTPRQLVAAETDPNMISVELPSGFYFYPFKELSVAPIRIKHQAKFARANRERSTRITVECITSLLGDGISAMDLTIPDFYWLLYWLRLNNYSKSPLTHRAQCTDPQHVLDVAEGRKDRASLFTISIVNQTNLKEKFLDQDAVSKFLATADVEEFESAGYVLSSPRMRDTVEVEEKWVNRDDFDELEYVADAAACLMARDGTHVSLEDRVAFLNELSPDAMATLTKFRGLVQNYGVEESLTTKCKDCNAVIETEISITAFDFL